MLKKNIILLKKITELNLDQLSHIIKKMIFERDNKIHILELMTSKCIQYLQNIQNLVYPGLDVTILNMYYNFLYAFHKEKNLLKKKISKINSNIKSQLILWKKLHVRLKKWDVLYNKKLYIENKNKILIKNKNLNTYFQNLYFKRNI